MNRAENRRQKKLADMAAKNTQSIQPPQITAQLPQPQQTMTIQQAINLGFNSHNSGDLLGAESIYQQILEPEPNQPVALHLSGVVAHQLGKNDLAVDLISKALTIRSDYAEAWNNLGTVLQKQGKLEGPQDGPVEVSPKGDDDSISSSFYGDE